MSILFHPYQPFPKPLPPVPVENQGPFCLEIDGKWIPYLLGAVSALAVDQTWQADQYRATGEARNLLGQLASAIACAVDARHGVEMEDCMGCCIRWSDAGILQVLSCGEWVDVPGPGSMPGGNYNQPAQGVPQPGAGECESFIGKVIFFGRWLLPVPVSTGDIVTVTNAFGATTDYLIDGLRWNCGDGTEFFASGCLTGSEYFDGSDPAPAFHHGNLIAFDGTNYYDCGPAANSLTATINIPPGITDQNLTFLINAPGPAGAGDLTFDVRICKGTAVPIQLTGIAGGTAAPANLSRSSVNIGDVFYVTPNLSGSSGRYDGGFTGDQAATYQVVSDAGYTGGTPCDWQWDAGTCHTTAPVAGDTSPSGTSSWIGNSSTQPTIGFKVLSIP